jgi:trehalose 2-sulfotransferase
LLALCSMDQPTAYILCSTPRSGTTLLCDLLAQTGVAGCPNSFFRQKSLQYWADEWALGQGADWQDEDFTAQYFAAMRRAGRGGTGVFGLRLMGADLQFASNWLAQRHPQVLTDGDRFAAAFGPLRYIYLSRSDKLAEAVSYIRAEQTGLWHGRPDGSTLEEMPPTLPMGYDATVITARMAELTAYDDAWPRWFEAQGIAPLTLTYEDLAAEPKFILAMVLRHIGQDPALAANTAPRLRKLADQTSADWIRRYRNAHPTA